MNENSTQAPTLEVTDPTPSLLAALWRRNLPILLERLDLLDHAAHQLQSGPLPNALLEEITSIAHKLAGSLGMFGYHQGTLVARDLEHLLDSVQHTTPTSTCPGSSDPAPDGQAPSIPAYAHRFRELTQTLRQSLPIPRL